MADKANDSQSTTNNKADDGSPPAYSYPVDAPPPYPQQSGYPGQPVHQVQPGYPDPPGYPGQPGYHAPPGYPGQPMHHAASMGGFMVSTAQPGPAYMVHPLPQATPPDYQGLAWFACLCCCWPLGIVAILKSNEVRNSIARGDYNSATIASNSARNFAYMAIGLGIAFLVMYIISMVMIFTFLSVS